MQHTWGNTTTHAPPITKPSPEALQELAEAVKTNPAAGPAKLRIGVPGRKPMPEVSDAFLNQDRLAHYRRKVSQQQISQKSDGIRTTTAALFDFARELPVQFFKDISLDPNSMVITMQTPSMEELLRKNCSAIQSDTLEGAVHDVDFDGEIAIHFTSCFDPICDRWVPVLVSIIFGKSHRHYFKHWQAFFACFNHITSWKQFEGEFYGVTIDWSDALGSSFLEALCTFSQRFDDGHISEEQAHSFVKKCHVHFLRSLTRVVRNGRVAKSDEEADELLALVGKMTSTGTTPREFYRACGVIIKKFPGAINWLKWHLIGKRARSYFPAVQDFEDKDYLRWFKLPSSTNAQENLGGLFKHLFLMGRKLTLNESIVSVFKFSSRFDNDRFGIMAGLSTKHCQFPRQSNPKGKRHKRTANDGRPPDKNSTLFPKKKLRRASTTQMRVVSNTEHRYEGPTWNFVSETGARITNTCPLDSFLMLLFVPVKGKAMFQPFPELTNKNSLLSRAFALMEKHNWDGARTLWLTDWFNHDMERPRNCFGDMAELFSNSKRKRSPLDASFRIKFNQMQICRREGGCLGKVGLDNDVEMSGFAQRVEKLTIVPTGDQTLTDCLEQLLGNVKGNYCQQTARSGCPGPTEQFAAQNIEWPHVLIMDCGGIPLDKLAFSSFGVEKSLFSGEPLCQTIFILLQCYE